MPYIKQEDRPQYDNAIKEVSDKIKIVGPDAKAGHLNYFISSLLWEVYGEKLRYCSINEIMGVLQCVGMEFYRRIACGYEDKKMVESGDVFNKK